MTVKIVVDSSAGLPHHLAREHDIAVAQLHVMTGEDRSSTAGLSALELCAVYARQLERGGDDGVVALHVAKELSGTWSSGATAAAVFPDGAVLVADTGTTGMALGLAAVDAAERAAAGATVAECHEAAMDSLARTRTWVYVHRLDDLRRSGRITARTAMMSALATKPIMTLSSGAVELAAKTRTQAKALQRLGELAEEHAEGRPARVVVQEHAAREAAERLARQLRAKLPEGSLVTVQQLAHPLGVHLGPGAVGITVRRAVEEPAD